MDNVVQGSGSPPARLVMRRRVWVGLALAVGLVLLFPLFLRPYASDRTPQGAYQRVALSVARDDPAGFFAYLETEAQWACYTVRDMRAKARARVAGSYPEPRRSELLAQYERVGTAPDGSDVFAIMYTERGWANRLRKDLSGESHVEIEGERASVVTVRGTRWPFRRRDNGIWGITIFTAELLADAEKATRDLAIVEAAAADYDRARAAGASSAGASSR